MLGMHKKQHASTTACAPDLGHFSTKLGVTKEQLSQKVTAGDQELACGHPRRRNLL
jgi:hypothetical protein